MRDVLATSRRRDRDHLVADRGGDGAPVRATYAAWVGRQKWAIAKGHALATVGVFVCLGVLFFTQNPIEARSRPWQGPSVSEDGWYYYHWLRSAAFDHDVDLTNDYRDFGNWYGFGRTPTGRPHNPFGIGPAVFRAPGFAVGHAIAKLGPEDRPDTVANGYSHAEQAGALFVSFLASAAAFWMTFDLCRRHVRPWTAWLATAVTFLGSPIVWYAVYSPAMPHALEACFASAYLWLLLPLRARTLREGATLGVAAGCMVLVRPQLAVFLAVPAAEGVCEVWRNRAVAGGLRSPVVSLVVTSAVAFVVFAPQLYVWKIVYGSWFVIPQGRGFMRFGESLWSETLFSSRNGLFTTTPLLWFALPGLYLVVRRDLKLGAVLLFLFAALAFTNGAAWDWWGGGAFGGRRFAALFPVWAVALAVLGETLVAPGRVRMARALLVAGCVGGLLTCRLAWSSRTTSIGSRGKRHCRSTGGSRSRRGRAGLDTSSPAVRSRSPRTPCSPCVTGCRQRATTARWAPICSTSAYRRRTRG